MSKITHSFLIKVLSKRAKIINSNLSKKKSKKSSKLPNQKRKKNNSKTKIKRRSLTLSTSKNLNL